MWKDLKYLLAYTAPLSMVLGLAWGGLWAWATPLLLFGIIPLWEWILPASTHNIPESEMVQRARRRFFDLLLYVHLPLLYGLLVWYFHTLQHGTWTKSELLGLTLGMGMIVGSFGINVGHELGHRPEWYHQLMAKCLLVPALYTHFTIAHNYGHHKWVATPNDPATARKGEPLYSFWLRAIVGTWREAWRLARKQISGKSLPWRSVRNEMRINLIMQVGWLVGLIAVWGWVAVLAAWVVALIAVLLLESVNYIEHYGLMRHQLPSGRYERVRPCHSWNANHELGRIFLYELTRHSDHHYKADRKYQTLRHLDESPQLPFGYPLSILIAMIPPLWFNLMDKQLDRHRQSSQLPTT